MNEIASDFKLYFKNSNVIAKNFYNNFLNSLKEKFSKFREDLNKKSTKTNKVHIQ